MLKEQEQITLPFLKLENVEDDAQEIYSRFMGHLRHVPISRMEIKVLSALQFTADMMDCSDAHVSKVLVDMGLRAPRDAFPMEFLDYMDRAIMRSGWDIGAPSKGMVALRDQWFSYQTTRNNTPFRHLHSVVEDDVLCR